MGMELIERIRAVLDEDEWIAIAAARRDDGREGSWTPVGLRTAFDARVDDHIARHDPARVLRQVAAHRKLLDVYQEADEWYNAHKIAAAGEITGLFTAIKLLAEALGITP